MQQATLPPRSGAEAGGGLRGLGGRPGGGAGTMQRNIDCGYVMGKFPEDADDRPPAVQRHPAATYCG